MIARDELTCHHSELRHLRESAKSMRFMSRLFAGCENQRYSGFFRLERKAEENQGCGLRSSPPRYASGLVGGSPAAVKPNWLAFGPPRLHRGAGSSQVAAYPSLRRIFGSEGVPRRNGTGLPSVLSLFYFFNASGVMPSPLGNF